MSEYWKSTPKIWCKHCKTFVRDTKLEKANHDATPKHQGNLKRFLRDLHREHDKGEKDKERAKSEIARLKGISSGDGASMSSGSGMGRGPTPLIPKPQATAADRQKQLAQLAGMGITLPSEFTPNNGGSSSSGPGTAWQVVSERIIEEDEGEKKAEATALGVRKREKREDEDEDEEAIEAKKRKWGSTHRTYPTGEEDGDLDALLNNVTGKGKEPAVAIKAATDTDLKPAIKAETEAGLKVLPSVSTEISPEDSKFIDMKKEDSDGATPLNAIPPDLKQEGETSVATGIVFKKRKAKNIRQK